MSDAVHTERRGRATFIVLDRPSALNAIDRNMVGAIHRALIDAIVDPATDRIVIMGTGERAFCAGGDVVGLYHAGRAGSDAWEGFFHDEYRLNQAIHASPTDYVALLDGVTMGGGVGLSIHGRFRVATERTLFAMPETAIGMIPDVGGTHALAALPGEIGTWLALTGARLRAADCIHAGIATHFVPVDRLGVLEAALADSTEPTRDVLGTLATDPGDATLAGLRDGVDFHFGHDRVEDIQASLADGDDWARAQHDVIARMSPTSLKLALRGLRLARGGRLEGALRAEYRMVCALKSGRDFYEGVRAQLIDKDKAPLWSPATLAEVDDAALAPYFREPASGDLRFD